MNIDKMIEQWEEKHSSLLNENSKGNINNEVMQMYRSQMKNVLDFINELKQIKNNFVLAEVREWIKVSEKKPQDGDMVDAYNIETDIYYPDLVFDEEKQKWLDERHFENGGYDSPPTHWIHKCQLPEVPTV